MFHGSVPLACSDSEFDFWNYGRGIGPMHVSTYIGKHNTEKKTYTHLYQSRNSSVRIVTTLRAGKPGFKF